MVGSWKEKPMTSPIDVMCGSPHAVPFFKVYLNHHGGYGNMDTYRSVPIPSHRAPGIGCQGRGYSLVDMDEWLRAHGLSEHGQVGTVGRK